MWFDVGICPIQGVRRLTESMVRDELPARRLARREPMVAGKRFGRLAFLKPRPVSVRVRRRHNLWAHVRPYFENGSASDPAMLRPF